MAPFILFVVSCFLSLVSPALEAEAVNVTITGGG
jgi:hypothetical protein